MIKLSSPPPNHTSADGFPFSACSFDKTSPDDISIKSTFIPVSFVNCWNIFSFPPYAATTLRLPSAKILKLKANIKIADNNDIFFINSSRFIYSITSYLLFLYTKGLHLLVFKASISSFTLLTL